MSHVQFSKAHAIHQGRGIRFVLGRARPGLAQAGPGSGPGQPRRALSGLEPGPGGAPGHAKTPQCLEHMPTGLLGNKSSNFLTESRSGFCHFHRDERFLK